MLSKFLSNKSFAIYGLGVTGSSVIKYFKNSKIKNYLAWDDDKKKRKVFKIKFKINKFLKSLSDVDYIVISPGINLEKSKYKRYLLKNKHKLITDLDIFYMADIAAKSIVVTGTNGKSTTCKIIEHMLKENKKKVQLGGNIGRPILSLKLQKNIIYVIETSSFQLEYSKFIKPTYAIILNIVKDHLDWHKTMKKYIDAKYKIFSLQDKKNYAFLKNKKLISKFYSKKSLAKLKIVKSKSYSQIKNNIKNIYLSSKANKENMEFVYELSKVLKITKKNLIKSLFTFKGLPHRHEIFLKKKNLQFINDSKATSFEATKFALNNNKNIYWIVGGLPKLNDNINLYNLKKKIIKVFIIGKHVNFFKNKLKNKIKFEVSKTLENSLISIFNEIKKFPNNNATVLLSPASASFDQYRNFNERGNNFKKLVNFYANKYLKR
jgi:UDP-N-acetylmuramoylalanine--D-glutamate ligase